MNDTGKVIEVEHLHVDFSHDGETHSAVDDVSFELFRGRTLGIVGESGSGKSVSTLSLTGLLPPSASVTGHAWMCPSSSAPDGSAVAKADLLSLGEDALRKVRGSRIGMIFQEPMTSLNPVHRCGEQVMEMLLTHESMPRAQARERVLELFGEVMLPRPREIFSSYPHQLSGGQKQRVMIAMALICHPAVLIADEPTTALDVTVQKAILDLLKSLQQRYDTAIIFITHDLGVVAQIADDVVVMHQGRVVERGPAAQVLRHPRQPYTRGLIACLPPVEGRPRRLPTVQDFLHPIPPDLSSLPLTPSPYPASSTPLLRVKDLEVTYALKKNLLGKPTHLLKAVDGVSFELYPGETLGLVGESGCGKSTLGRAILQLIDHSGGTVEFDGISLDHLSRTQRKELRHDMQIVFQDPYSSLNPRLTVGEAIMEPLEVHRMGENRHTRRHKVLQLMERVGLRQDWWSRYPHQLSGGQRQRVCIARALILEPRVVVCDESVSALDVSVQAQVLNLLNDLKEQCGYTYLFITHNLAVAKYFSNRILVMRSGRIVEEGPSDQLFAHPQHPYTQRLLAALPRL